MGSRGSGMGRPSGFLGSNLGRGLCFGFGAARFAAVSKVRRMVIVYMMDEITR